MGKIIVITITESAKIKISEVLAEENNKSKLRMFVEGGGCSGFNYGFSIDEEQAEDDFVIPVGSSSVLVDPISAQYLMGATVDYKNDLEGARFSILNPQAQSTCGCGSSFSPY
jgi:iron-sulfur cluster insertion protein